MSLPQLPGLLGAQRKAIPANTHIDSIVTPGSYFGNPLGTVYTDQHSILLDVGYNDVYGALPVIQKITVFDTAEVYIRNKVGDTWSSWIRCDNFGCNTASELASLLGAIGKQKTVDTDTDCNTLTNTGFYFFGTSGRVSAEEMHKPTTNNCCVLVISGYTIIQFHIDQHGTVHLRSQNTSGNWSSWAQLL